MGLSSNKSIFFLIFTHRFCKRAINIINNALDAMPDGGTLTFKTWSEGDTVFASVTDTGKGMSEEVRKCIFEPFFTTRSPEGTGLGMSMAYGTVAKHSGKIDVTSEIGEGTIFIIQLPIANANKDVKLAVTPEPEQETDLKSLRILVVDDEEVFCDTIDRFLSIKGHNVKTVDNGRDAIDLIESEDFDLVLCDLAMPIVSGYDVAEVVNRQKRRPKFGLITGWPKGLENVTDKNLNVDFYIKKPFKHAELVKHIDELFGADGK